MDNKTIFFGLIIGLGQIAISIREEPEESFRSRCHYQFVFMRFASLPLPNPQSPFLVPAQPPGTAASFSSHK